MAGRTGKLGPVLGAFVVATTTIGSGLYLIPASMALVGSVSILGWIAATLGAVFLCGVFSCLAVVKPGPAGLFGYIAEALGPAAGFMVGMLYWCPISIVPIAVGLTGYIGFFVPAAAHGTAATWTTLGLIWLFIGANIIGPRFIARLGGLTLVMGLAPVVLIAVMAMLKFHPAVFAASWNVSGRPALAVVPQSAVTAFYAYLGIEAAIVIAPVMRDPQRDTPIATFAGLAIAAMVYIGASGAIMGVLPAAALARSTAPFADAAVPLMGASIAGILALCTLLKVSGSFGGAMLTALETADSPAVFGALMPAVGRVAGEGRGQASSLANLGLIGVVMSLMVIASASPTLARQFSILADISVVLNLIAYLAACLALLRFSAAAPPRLKWISRFCAVAAALFCMGMIAVSERDLLVWSAGAIAVAGLAWLAARRWVNAAVLAPVIG